MPLQCHLLVVISRLRISQPNKIVHPEIRRISVIIVEFFASNLRWLSYGKIAVSKPKSLMSWGENDVSICSCSRIEDLFFETNNFYQPKRQFWLFVNWRWLKKKKNERLKEWRTDDWLTNWLTLTEWLSDCLTVRLADCPTDCMNEWMNENQEP